MKASFLSWDKVRIALLALKKIKIQVFATITLLVLSNHHEALVYLTTDFPTLPSHHPKNSGDDENINSCIELLCQVLVFTHP